MTVLVGSFAYVALGFATWAAELAREWETGARHPIAALHP